MHRSYHDHVFNNHCLHSETIVGFLRTSISRDTHSAQALLTDFKLQSGALARQLQGTLTDAAESEHRSCCKSGTANSGIAGDPSQNSLMGSRLSGPVTNAMADQGIRSGVSSANEGLKALRRLGSVSSAAAMKCITNRQSGGSGGSCASVDGFSGGSTGGGCGGTGFDSRSGDGGLAANGQMPEGASEILHAGPLSGGCGVGKGFKSREGVPPLLIDAAQTPEHVTEVHAEKEDCGHGHDDCRRMAEEWSRPPELPCWHISFIEQAYALAPRLGPQSGSMLGYPLILPPKLGPQPPIRVAASQPPSLMMPTSRPCLLKETSSMPPMQMGLSTSPPSLWVSHSHNHQVRGQWNVRGYQTAV